MFRCVARRYGTDRPGTVLHDMAHGTAYSGTVRFGTVRYGTVPFGTVWCDIAVWRARSGISRHVTAAQQQYVVQCKVLWYCKVRLHAIQHGTVWYGAVRKRMVQHRVVQHGAIRYDVDCRTTAPQYGAVLVKPIRAAEFCATQHGPEVQHRAAHTCVIAQHYYCCTPRQLITPQFDTLLLYDAAARQGKVPAVVVQYNNSSSKRYSTTLQ